jgi:hypothetical protein
VAGELKEQIEVVAASQQAALLVHAEEDADSGLGDVIYDGGDGAAAVA